jgi:hypothetical protein
MLDSFIHVVDYYYGKAGLPVPQPADPENAGGYPSAEELALNAAEPIDPRENARVLHQILLHLDCDDVDMFQLHEIRLLLHNDPASKGHRYAAVLNYCFSAMRLGFRQRPANDAQWRICQSPWLMLDSLQCRVSDRKLRLYAVACCRRLPHVLADERCRSAVEVAERYADGRAEGAELATAEDATKDATNRQGTDSPAAWAVTANAGEAARMAALFASVDSDAGREEEAVAQAALLRCILGNHFHPVTFSPSWRTHTVLSLARQMYESRDFSAMPILADALQDDGCDNEDVLPHCRDTSLTHVRGCWVMDELLGNS